MSNEHEKLKNKAQFQLIFRQEALRVVNRSRSVVIRCPDGPRQIIRVVDAIKDDLKLYKKTFHHGLFDVNPRNWQDVPDYLVEQDYFSEQGLRRILREKADTILFYEVENTCVLEVFSWERAKKLVGFMNGNCHLNARYYDLGSIKRIYDSGSI